ncbi:hypothetical protein [Streptomyces sp. NBC_01210]|uniref:hypothetical protein n=1 Tax=Streptomyces sp. NBC_01210 TaxID=2903774 RepID=UPI003FA36D6C
MKCRQPQRRRVRERGRRDGQYGPEDEADEIGSCPREETGADPADQLPTLITGQLCWVQTTLLGVIGREMVAGRKPDEVSRESLDLLDDMEDVPGEKVLKYAVREA